jgi:hypothetical protein
VPSEVEVLRITNYELRITNYELRITNYELRITNYELRITNYELRITNYFNLSFIQTVVNENKLKLIIYNVETEVIEQWTN